MPIPESQLKVWANQGATDGSARTYASIKAALDTYSSWPDGMRFDVYLQGSYPNATNTRGNSDVDVVAEMTSINYSNLTKEEKQKLSLGVGKYSHKDFREEVLKALKSYYGKNCVDDSGGKAIKIPASSGRLNADVVPCVKYRRYDNLRVVAEGITFWNQRTGDQIINYPKLHIRNGEQKNSSDRTKGGYKPSLRMFKNARSCIVGDSAELKGKYPSYFVECLFSNLLDSVYLNSYQYTYEKAVADLLAAFKNGSAAKFKTQSGRHWLFGKSSVQWSQESAYDLTLKMQQLWNGWYQ